MLLLHKLFGIRLSILEVRRTNRWHVFVIKNLKVSLSPVMVLRIVLFSQNLSKSIGFQLIFSFSQRPDSIDIDPHINPSQSNKKNDEKACGSVFDISASRIDEFTWSADLFFFKRPRPSALVLFSISFFIQR